MSFKFVNGFYLVNGFGSMKDKHRFGLGIGTIVVDQVELGYIEIFLTNQLIRL